MDRARRGMRKTYSWVRTVLAVGLIGLSAWTLYQNYFEDNDDEDSLETTTTTLVEGGSGGTGLTAVVTGPVPGDRIGISVSSSADGSPATHLTDGDPATAWSCSPCVSADAPGFAETITFDLHGEVSIESIQIRNGFPEGTGFLANNRIQRLQIDLGSGPQETTLPDTPDLVTIEIAGPASKVTLSVLSIYQAVEGGGGFGISEVTVVGAYAP